MMGGNVGEFFKMLSAIVGLMAGVFGKAVFDYSKIKKKVIWKKYKV